MNQGIMDVDQEFLDRCRSMLPPEHRIVGETLPDIYGRLRLLVEGPDLPPAVRGGIPTVVIFCRVSRVDGRLRTEASWGHKPDHWWPVPDADVAF